MADDALSCFTSLLESVPAWISELEGILKTASDRQHEFLFANQPAEAAAPKPRKSLSVESLRPDEAPKTAELLKPQLAHLTPSDALHLSQRKRKTASVNSGQLSGPSKYRSRSLVVVYYDSEVQKLFESLVRQVGTCRNAIRKGKMSAKVESLSRTSSSSSEDDKGFEHDSAEDVIKSIKKVGYRSTRGPMDYGAVGRKDDGGEAFDKADTCLEKAQMLLERAAHQILRDGDVQIEVENTKEALREATKLAEAELPQLKKAAAKAAEKRRRSAERRREEEEEEAKSKRKQEEAKAKIVQVLAAQQPDNALEVDDLEVDDSEDEDMDFSLAKFRMASSRLPTHTPVVRA